MNQIKRNRSVVSFLVVLVWLLFSLIQSQEVYAGGKNISGTGKPIALISETKTIPGDDPNHEFALSTSLHIINSSDPDWNNVQVKHIVVTDYTAGTGIGRGYRIHSHPGGDQTVMAIEGMTKTVMKSESFPDISFEGKWWFTGGTGKFEGITGSGTYWGKVTEEGVTYDWEGVYEVK